ncbi:MAG: universal stress protein [Vicinamibacterales bacterium]
MSTILLASDGSVRSLRVLPHALRLAQWTDATLISARFAFGTQEAPTEAQATARSLEAAAEQDGARLIVESRVVYPRRGESMAARILRFARAKGAELIALDASGEDAIQRSAALKLLWEMLVGGDRPILITGANARPPDSSTCPRLAVATDLSAASLAMMPLLANWRPTMWSDVTLLTVCGMQSGRPCPEAEIASARRRLNDAARALPAAAPLTLRAEPIRAAEPVEDAILRSVAEAGADFLMVGSSGAAGASGIGRTALRLMDRASLPLIIAPPGHATTEGASSVGGGSFSSCRSETQHRDPGSTVPPIRRIRGSRDERRH